MEREETLDLRIHEIKYYCYYSMWTRVGKMFVGDPSTRREVIIAPVFWMPSDLCCEASGSFLNLSDSFS